MTITVQHDPRGAKLALSGLWSAEDASTVISSPIKRLQVQLGYLGDNLDFLSDLADLEQIEVHRSQLRSDGGVQAVTGLRELTLETYSRDRIDFGRFERLERLYVRWRPGAESLTGCRTLRSLSVAGGPWEDLTPLERLTRLEALQIGLARRLRSLDGLSALPSLCILTVAHNRSLADIAAIEGLETLVDVRFDHCPKVRDLAPMAGLINVRRLMLTDCGHVASLLPLSDLPKLEEFYFYGETVVDDGDMSPLLTMPALKSIAFAPRRHYNYHPDEIEQLRGLVDSEPMPHWRF